MAATQNFAKGYRTIAQAVFDSPTPEAESYISEAQATFGGTFFEALAGFCKVEQGAEHFVRQVLGVSLADAKALSGELRK